MNQGLGQHGSLPVLAARLTATDFAGTGACAGPGACAGAPIFLPALLTFPAAAENKQRQPKCQRGSIFPLPQNYSVLCGDAMP
jgi:hypothetical protein